MVKAITASHGMLKNGLLDNNDWNPWNDQGKRMYDGLKANKNIIMFICGHVKEGYREEVFEGRKIPIYMSDIWNIKKHN